MNQAIEFVKGQQYTNRRGTYTVLDVRGTSLTVRYDDGAEETLDMTIQQRILANMTLPPRTPEPPPRKRTGVRIAPPASTKRSPAPPAVVAAPAATQD